MCKLPGPHGEVPSCEISAIAEAASSIRRGEGQGNAQVSETNSENVEVGKRVTEYNAPMKWSVAVEFQRARESSSAVHHAHCACVGVAFLRRIREIFSTKCSRRAIRENLDPRNISAIRYSFFHSALKSSSRTSISFSILLS